MALIEVPCSEPSPDAAVQMSGFGEDSECGLGDSPITEEILRQMQPIILQDWGPLARYGLRPRSEEVFFRSNVEQGRFNPETPLFSPYGQPIIPIVQEDEPIFRTTLPKQPKPRRRPLHGLADLCVDAEGNAVSCGGAPSGGSPASGGDGWAWLQSLITGGVKTVENIYTAKNIPRGVYTQTGPGGVSTTYVQPTGSSTTLPVGTGTFQGTANTGFGMVLVGGAALLVLFMMMRRK